LRRNLEIIFAMTRNFNKICLLLLKIINIRGRLSAKQIILLKVDYLNSHLQGFTILVLNAANNNMMYKMIDALIAFLNIEKFVTAAQI
jgi:1-deoxy-D-xylulose 5-phosphate reductoisomerase